MFKIPLVENGKEPIPGQSWKETASDDPVLHRLWQQMGLNAGLLTGQRTNGIVARDIEHSGIDLAREEFHNKITRGFYKCLVRTPGGGIHIYLRAPKFRVPNAVRVGGQPVDLRSDGGYVVATGSVIQGKAYEYIPGFELRDVDDLPVFPEIWLPPSKTIIDEVSDIDTTMTSTKGSIDSTMATAVATIDNAIITPTMITEADGIRRIIRARAYAAAVKCVEHRAAHNTFYRMLCWMRDEAKVTKGEALAIVLSWVQTNCFRKDGVTPYPWSPAEIMHKLNDVFP